MNIQTPVPPKIDASGIYDLTDREYHSDCCAGPSISSTGLKTIKSQGAAKYWWDSYLNPEHQARQAKLIKDGKAKEPAHFRLGKAAHMLLLEPERVRRWITKIPQSCLAKNGAASTSDAKAIIAEAEAAGRIPVKPDEWAEIVAMRDALAAHPHAKRALLKGRAEVSLIIKDETDIFVKSRPDFLPEESGQYIADYKTTADLSKWERTATVDLRYDMQAALMLWAAREVADIEAKGVLYLVQEKKPPYAVGMMAFSLSDLNSRAMLDVARLHLRDAINTFSFCWQNNTWPTGYEEPREIEAPHWHRREVEFALENNTQDFPNAYAL